MPKTKIIGLISSVPMESRFLLQKVEGKKRLAPGLHAGIIGSKRIVHITSGIGVANAAHAATVLIERIAPVAIIVFGIGGAYQGSGLQVGDIALAETEIYADAGVHTPYGLKGFEMMGFPLVQRGAKRYYNSFPLDKRLLSHGRKKLGSVMSGAFLTVCSVTGTRRRGQELRRRYGALCENMEGAAVVQVCARYGVPALELRGISNMVESRNTAVWRKDEAARFAQDGVLKLLV